jgi:DNA-binding MarR family transcriptional regulator
MPATSPPEPEADALALIQLSGMVQETFARVADKHELTPVQGRMLCVLARKPYGMAELARVFGVGKANLTGLIDRAEARGLVSRSLVPGDRRAIQVLLTEDGRRAARAFHEEVTAELAGYLDPLAPGERVAFRTAAAAVAGTAGHGAGWDPRRLDAGS